MSHDLFSDVVSPGTRVRSGSRYTIAVSIAAHVLIVTVVIVAPLFMADVLPMPVTGPLAFIAASAAPAPPPPPAAPVAPQAAVNPDAAPTDPPDGITEERPRVEQPPGETVVGGLSVGGGTQAGIGDSIGLGLDTTAPAPPPPPPPAKPFRVGGQIRQPVKVHNVVPVYPQIAQSARISGIIIIEAIIDTDGTITGTRVLRGVPLLNDAALDAVRQWRYTPTMLNGTPVQVIMTVTVNFQQQQP